MIRITIALILSVTWGYVGSELLTPFDGVLVGIIAFGLLLMMFGVLDSGHDSRSYRRDRW